MSRALQRTISPLLLLAVLALLGMQAYRALGPAPTVTQGVAPPATPPFLTIGATTTALARNAATPWQPEDLREVDAFERAAQRHAGIVMWFADFAGPVFDPAQARAVAARGAVPEVSWEPWDASRLGARQPRYALRTIIAGEHDAVIRRWARAIAVYEGPLRLRFAHEMNGRWYPWAERVNGNRDGEYVQAWRHVRSIFREEGATNVRWIWAPVAGGIPRRLFPGEREVDVVGLSGFNGGDLVFKQRWRSFEAAFAEPLARLHDLAPRRPVEIAEIASTEQGGSKAAWIRELFDGLRKRPYVRSLVWFELRKETDWRIESSPAAREAFAAGAAEALRPPAELAPAVDDGASRGERSAAGRR